MPQDALSWDNFPAVTEREKQLPWYNNRFKERPLEVEEAEEEALREQQASLHLRTGPRG